MNRVSSSVLFSLLLSLFLFLSSLSPSAAAPSIIQSCGFTFTVPTGCDIDTGNTVIYQTQQNGVVYSYPITPASSFTATSTPTSVVPALTYSSPKNMQIFTNTSSSQTYLYVAEAGSGSTFGRVNLANNVRSTVLRAASVFMYDACVDKAGKYMYQISSAGVYRVDLVTSTSVFMTPTNAGGASTCAFSADESYLYVLQSNSVQSTYFGVLRVALAAMAADNNATAYNTAAYYQTIIKCTSCPQMTMDRTRQYFYIAYKPSSSYIYRISVNATLNLTQSQSLNLITDGTLFYSYGSSSSFGGMCIDRSNTFLYVSIGGTGTLTRYSLDLTPVPVSSSYSQSASFSPSASRSLSASQSASFSPSLSQSRSLSASMSASRSASQSLSQSLSQSQSQSLSKSQSFSQSVSASLSATQSATVIPSSTFSSTASAAGGASTTRSASASASASASQSVSVSAGGGATVGTSSTASTPYSRSASASYSVSVSAGSSNNPTPSASGSASASPSSSGGASGNFISLSASISLSSYNSPSNQTVNSMSLSLSQSPSRSASASLSASGGAANSQSSTVPSTGGGFTTANPSLSPSPSGPTAATLSSSASPAPTPSRSGSSSSASLAPANSISATRSTSRSLSYTSSASNGATAAIGSASSKSSASATGSPSPSLSSFSSTAPFLAPPQNATDSNLSGFFDSDNAGGILTILAIVLVGVVCVIYLCYRYTVRNSYPNNTNSYSAEGSNSAATQLTQTTVGGGGGPSYYHNQGRDSVEGSLEANPLHTLPQGQSPFLSQV